MSTQRRQKESTHCCIVNNWIFQIFNSVYLVYKLKFHFATQEPFTNYVKLWGGRARATDYAHAMLIRMGEPWMSVTGRSKIPPKSVTQFANGPTMLIEFNANQLHRCYERDEIKSVHNWLRTVNVCLSLADNNSKIYKYKGSSTDSTRHKPTPTLKQHHKEDEKKEEEEMHDQSK